MPINTGTESATIRLDSTGAVTGSFGIASHGQGLETTLAQVIADELGARIEDVRILHGDSAVVAHGTGTYASRSAVLAGGAATLAARLLKERVIRAASHLLEASVEDIEAVDGRVFVAGTDRSLTFREIAKAVYSEMGRLPRDAREELEVTKVYDPYFGTTTSATHIVAVEIDPETYKVELDRYVVAEDCGHMINPMIVDGQVHGAVAQGIGAALYEEVIYDAAGQLLTASLADYAIPTASEVPSIATVHLEAESPSHCGRLPRHGRRRDDWRAGGHCQRACRCARSARSRDFRAADDSGAPISPDREGLGASARRVAMDLKLEGPELRWLLAERTTRAS
jgi:carbon-monoxide dehydrogenase large subunit